MGKFILIVNDGNNFKAILKDLPDTDFNAGTATNEDWGLPETLDIVAVIQTEEPVEDTTVWIDGEEQVFHQ